MFYRLFALLLQQAEAVWRTVVKTGTGMIVATDTTEGQPVDIQLQGWTEQNQYEGKNLLSNIPSDWTMNKGLSWGARPGTEIGYASNATYSSVIIIHGIKNNTKYSFKNLDTKKLWFSRVIEADENGIGYVNINLYGNAATQNKEEYSFTVSNENVTTFYIVVRTVPESGTGAGASADITEDDIRNMQICLSDGDPIYEPYTEGQSSPSPEYPQDIVNSGKYNEETGKYEVVIEVSVAQKYNGGHERDTFLNTDGTTIEYSGRSTTGFIKVNPNTKYSGFSKYLRRCFFDSDRHLISYNDNATETELTQENCEYVRFNFVNDSKVMFNIGEKVLPYQEYEEPQTVTVTSDRPITKWDRLVDKDGVIGWEYGSAIISSYNGESVTTEYYSTTGQLTTGAEVVYKLETPEFVPLPTEEQKAIRELKTYYPTTVFSNDQEMFMQVEYQTKVPEQEV